MTSISDTLPNSQNYARYKVPLVLLRVMAGSSGASQLILLERQIVRRGFGYGVFTALGVLRATNGAFPRRISLGDPSHEKFAPKVLNRQMVGLISRLCGTRLVRRSGAIPGGSTSPASTLGLIDEPFVPAFTLAISPRTDTRATPVAASQVVPSPTNKPAPVANWHLNYEAVACLSYPAVNMPSWICLEARMDTALAQ